METTSGFGLVSLDEARKFLNLGEDTDRDAWLSAEIDAVSESIEQYLDRRIVARTYREDTGAEMEDNTLYLQNTPILEVNKIYDDPDLKFEDDTLLDADDYNVFEDRIEFRTYESPYIAAERRRRWRRLSTANTIRVEYVAGYAAIEIPFGRQRLDFKETTGGDTLTVYLNFGRFTPKEIVVDLTVELNSVGTHEREVSFDWKTRKFTIQQPDGQLSLLPSVDDEFSESESALPLLGFTGSGYTTSPAVGSPVALEIPADLKRAVLNLIALQYDKGSHGRASRGLKSQQIRNIRVEYVNDNMFNMPAEVESVLLQYRKVIYV